ncbi:MAG TPA: phosphate-starvation-inducible protein PsiE [Thermopetrobacter sp.]|nr:phosphate-starvation-inducible protein PsiE [Thermopetrobacter sp.]
MARDGGDGRIFIRAERAFSRHFDPLGNLLVDVFHYIALFAIGALTFWAAVQEVLLMFQKSHATVEDLLLLFIYLEIGSMVGIYFRTNRLPVRFLVYVAITALTRLLIGEAGKHSDSHLDMMFIAGSTLLLAVALLVLRYGSSQFPSPPTDQASLLRRAPARDKRET